MALNNKIQFDILTIFPGIFDSYLAEGIISRAVNKKILKINVHDLRDFSSDKRRTVDDTTYGGGPGMVLKIEPIFKALRKIKVIDTKGRRTRAGKKNTRIIIASAKGKIFDQEKAIELSKYKRIVIICGRYEGIDERVAEHLSDEEISVGEYVLTGGELAAMIFLDSITRLKRGVVGNRESVLEESFSKKGYLEYPHYTKPESFIPVRGLKWNVPKVLLSGDHKKIKEWRDEKSKNSHNFNGKSNTI